MNSVKIITDSEGARLIKRAQNIDNEEDIILNEGENNIDNLMCILLQGNQICT